MTPRILLAGREVIARDKVARSALSYTAGKVGTPNYEWRLGHWVTLCEQV